MQNKKISKWLYRLVLIAVISVLCCGIQYVRSSWYKWTHDENFTPARLPVSVFREGPEYIAHAGGKIDGAIYTNSREALEQSILLGHRFIEIDFKATIGGELYGCHSKREFNARTGRKWLGHIPMTVGMVQNVKIDGKFTPIFMREIYEILKKHPDIYLVTDKVTDYDAIIEQFPLPNQLIVETFEPNQYYEALAKGIKYVTFAGPYEEMIKVRATLAVMDEQCWKDPKIRQWVKDGNTAMFLKQEIYDKHDFPLGTLAYSDTCHPRTK